MVDGVNARRASVAVIVLLIATVDPSKKDIVAVDASAMACNRNEERMCGAVS